ncbi:MAG: ParB/RepB/Spo0J family partition protein [bacterium]|nr:ParB/RepB/Spo0J family partition protein [bacterium]MDE0288066.1 ParB/RepB/Spo0J family partition protein [bacterium]MDE0438513.1 ParB/RepB/Spo0J family partition protein [bacterium]
MATRRSGLGKGLEALIPLSRVGNLQSISVGRLRPNPNQPRKSFDPGAMEALTASIRSVGLLQPVVVRPEGLDYVLIAGERRWRAAREAGLEEIPALIRQTDEMGSLTEALIENLQREDLTPLEAAAAFQQLEEDFGMTHAEIGERVGRSRSAVSNTLRLLNLSAPIQQALEAGDLSAGHARALLGVEDPALAEHLAERTVAEGWSVRRLEEAVRAGRPAEDKQPPGREVTPRPAAIIELEHRLAEQLGTNVRINYRNNRGQVVLRFAGLDQLEQIYRRFFTS